MQKARRHHKWLRPLVGVRFQVLFHSPVRSAFHLSLTVLIHYRSQRSIQPYQMVLADSHKLPLISWYSGVYSEKLNCFCLRDYHLLWFNFPENSANNLISYFSALSQIGQNTSHYPANTTVASFNMLNGLSCFPFARHYSGNHGCFLFLRVLRCFSSPG